MAHNHISSKSESSISIKYDFTKKYNPDDFSVSLGDDGKVKQDKKRGLIIDSSPYKITRPYGENDHPKWFHFSKETLDVSKIKKQVVYEFNVSAEQTFDLNKIPECLRDRIRNVQEDPRIASSAINILDVPTSTIVGVYLTNQVIYAGIARLPNNQTPENYYSAKVFLVPIASRAGLDPLCEYVTLSIGINPYEGEVSWYVNGSEVYSNNQIGLSLSDQYIVSNLGGNDEHIKFTQLKVGFGTINFLDFSLPNNYSREYVKTLVLKDSKGRKEIERQIDASALVEIFKTSRYRELYESLSGEERKLVDVEQTFAYPYSGDNQEYTRYKLFGEGSRLAITYIKRFLLNDC